jgi:hypothetical protein
LGTEGSNQSPPKKKHKLISMKIVLFIMFTIDNKDNASDVTSSLGEEENGGLSNIVNGTHTLIKSFKKPLLHSMSLFFFTCKGTEVDSKAGPSFSIPTVSA